MDEEQQKSEAPRLLEIAAQITVGLLASGNYTEEGYHASTARPGYRIEVVKDAIELAHHLIRAVEAHGPVEKITPPK